MPLDDRWIPVCQFIEEEQLELDDLFRFADAKLLPPHAWVGSSCLVDRRKLFSWRQLVELDGLVPSARVKAEMGA